MDALRRAEEAKRLADPSSRVEAAVSADEMALDPLESLPNPRPGQPPRFSRHPEAGPADPAADATPLPPGRDEPRFADAASRQAAGRAAARNVFAAKEAPRPRASLWLVLGLVGVAMLGIVGYFWWQLQSVGGSSIARPAPPPALATQPVLPATLGVAAPPPLPALAPEATPAQPRQAPRASAAASRADRPAREAASIPHGEAPGLFRPSHPRATAEQPLNQAYEALQADRPDEARRGYEQVLRSDSRNADALLGLAVIAARQGQLDRAQHLYRQVLEADPSDVTAQAALINLRGEGDAGHSESRLKTLLASQPDSPALHFALGNIYAFQGRWSEAQQVYFKAYAVEPDNADYIFNVAVSLDHLRQNKLAAQYYRMALAAAQTRNSAFDKDAAGKRILELQP